MDRKLLVDLLKDGMRYPVGKHRVWISRCFEVTVRSDRVVELDEYEGYTEETHADSNRLAGSNRQAGSKRRTGVKPKEPADLFHVGKSVIHPKQGTVIEEPGRGWTTLS